MKIVPPGNIGPFTCWTPRARVVAAVLLAVPLFAPFMGCWPFHHGPTPQQKFFDALNRGDAVEANQTWLTMSAEDREKLSRGEGVAQRPSAEEIQAAIQRHKAGDTTPEIIDVPQPAGAIGGWQTLPQVLRATPIPPQTR
jgi:hypothetical protein